MHGICMRLGVTSCQCKMYNSWCALHRQAMRHMYKVPTAWRCLS